MTAPEHASDTWFALKEPFVMLKKKKVELSIFVAVNLVIGMLGIHLAWLMPLFSPAFSFCEQLARRLDGGELYTFIIALLTSTLVLLVQGYSQRTLQQVRDLKFQTIVLLVIVIALAALGAGAQAFLASSGLPIASGAYLFQLMIWVLGFLLAIYCFLVAIYEQDLDDFAEREDAARYELQMKARTVASDGRGMDI
jgi:hypothetical protein